MKLYFAIIDDVGAVHRHVVTGSPISLLQQVFVCLPTGEFDLDDPSLSDRVEDVEAAFYAYMRNMSAVEAINRIAALLTHKERNERLAERLAEDLTIFNLTDDGEALVTFLDDLRSIFNGTEYELLSETEVQTTIIVRIEE